MAAPILAYSTVKLRAGRSSTTQQYDAIVRDEVNAALANHSEREVYRDVVRSWQRAQPFSEEWEFYRAIKRGFDSYTLGLAQRYPILPARNMAAASDPFYRLHRSHLLARGLHRRANKTDPLFEDVAPPSYDFRGLSSGILASTHLTRIEADTHYMKENRGQETTTVEVKPGTGKQENVMETVGLDRNQIAEDDFVVVDSRASSPELYISDDEEVVCLLAPSPKN